MLQYEPLLLSLETSTRCSSVALTRGTFSGGAVLAELSLNSNTSHSRRLIAAVDRLFQETQTDWQQIAGIGIGLGPGSFTGLRIGMATAKGFAQAAQKKLLGVSTLDTLAAMCVPQERICAVLDARKKEVYAAFYRWGEDKGIVREGEMRALSPKQLAEEIQEPTMMVGDGCITYGRFFRDELKGVVSFAPVPLHRPSAAAVGLLCGRLYENNEFLDIAGSVPFYVRASDAELSLAKQRRRTDSGGAR